MLNALNQDLYLIQYRIAIKKGEIIAGQELTMELDRLINDLGNPRYYYDTTEAYKRIHFMEGCIRLTKSQLHTALKCPTLTLTDLKKLFC